MTGRMGRSRLVVSGVAVSVAVGLAAACSKTETPPATTAAPSTEAPATTVSPGTTASPGTTRAPGTTAPRSTTGTGVANPDPEAAEYCAVVRDDLDTVQNGFDDPDRIDAFIVVLGDMEEVAPDDQKANVAAVRAVARELSALPKAEQEAKSLELIGRTDFIAAATSLALFTEEQCGVNLNGSSGSGSGTGDISGGSGSDGGAGDDEPVTPRLDDLKATLQATPGSQEWYGSLNGFGIGSLGNTADITLNAVDSADPLTPAGALAACTAAAAWGETRFDAVKVTVSGPNEVVLASKPADASSCQAG